MRDIPSAAKDLAIHAGLSFAQVLRSGRRRQRAGFVEPLEATALMVICGEMQALASRLLECDAAPTDSLRRIYNRFMSSVWDEARDFLAVRYRFNTRLDTPFWQHCRAATPLRTAEEIVEFYEENGPNHSAQVVLVRPGSAFGMNGFRSLLSGQAVPTRYRYDPAPAERETWRKHCQELEAAPACALTVPQTFGFLRDPRWQWGS